jgi:hypothetical protein
VEVLDALVRTAAAEQRTPKAFEQSTKDYRAWVAAQRQAGG